MRSADLGSAPGAAAGVAPGAAAERWLLCPRPRERPAAVRLLCLPHAGGGVAGYAAWPALLPAWVEPWVLRLPGRDGRAREPARTALRELAAEAAPACAARLAPPLALFGHSLGAFAAFELARQLRAGWGIELAYLGVSSRAAPQLADHHTALRQLPDDALLRTLQDRYQAVPAELHDDAELMSRYLPMLRADVTMLETYRCPPGDPLRCPLGIYGGRDDPESDEPGLRAWGEHTISGCSLTLLPGGHFYLRTQAPALTAHLTADLQRCLIP
jgi:surfactin synthase thioesterase subunit